MDDAMAIMENQQFDLVLLGRRSLLPRKQIDQRLREKYTDLLILKIENLLGMERSIYPSRMTDSEPGHVLEALHQMLGDRVRLVPFEPTSDPLANLAHKLPNKARGVCNCLIFR
jgi:hypothetical protein